MSLQSELSRVRSLLTQQRSSLKSERHVCQFIIEPMLDALAGTRRDPHQSCLKRIQMPENPDYVLLDNGERALIVRRKHWVKISIVT